MQATTKDAYSLIHRGAIALSRVEQNGIKIDTEYLDATIKQTAERIQKLETKLRDDPIFLKWRRRYGIRPS